MSFLKKILIITFISLGTLSPVFVFADAYGLSTAGETAGLSQLAISNKTIPVFAGEIVSVGLSLIGIIFFLLMIYAGIRWMIAAGKSEDVQKAKDTLEAAAIGLVIVLSAYAITQFVFSSLLSGGGGGGSGPAGGGGIQACVANADCSGGVCVGGFCQGASGPTPLVPQNCADCCQTECLASYPDNVDDCRVECQACKDSARVAYSDAYNNCTMKGCADFRVGIVEAVGDCKAGTAGAPQGGQPVPDAPIDNCGTVVSSFDCQQPICKWLPGIGGIDGATCLKIKGSELVECKELKTREECDQMPASCIWGTCQTN